MGSNPIPSARLATNCVILKMELERSQAGVQHHVIWHLVVELAVEVAAVGFGGAAAPLLEEEGDVWRRCTGRGGLVAHSSVHGAGSGAAFASGYEPVDAR